MHLRLRVLTLSSHETKLGRLGDRGKSGTCEQYWVRGPSSDDGLRVGYVIESLDCRQETRGQDIEHVVGQPSVRECTRLAPAALFYAYLGLVEETKSSVLQVKWGLWLPYHDLPQVMFVCVFVLAECSECCAAEKQNPKKRMAKSQTRRLCANVVYTRFWKTQESKFLAVKPGVSALLWSIPDSCWVIGRDDTMQACW